jgi:hypothetical protein
MGKIHDFYKKVGADAAIQRELRAAVIAETVKVAGKHGVTLAAADFDEMDEGELDAVTGGTQWISMAPPGITLKPVIKPITTISGGSWSDPNPHVGLG